MYHPDDILGLHDPEGHGWDRATASHGIVPPPVGEDGPVEAREPLDGRTGAPPVVTESME
jgi:hypothetical protein